eukprot:365818-Chlamydomonas_euryale.AAC.3
MHVVYAILHGQLLLDAILHGQLLLDAILHGQLLLDAILHGQLLLDAICMGTCFFGSQAALGTAVASRALRAANSQMRTSRALSNHAVRASSNRPHRSFVLLCPIPSSLSLIR